MSKKRRNLKCTTMCFLFYALDFLYNLKFHLYTRFNSKHSIVIGQIVKPQIKFKFQKNMSKESKS